MPTFVPSSFSSTISDPSARKRSDSASPRCLSSSVPLEPKRWGVLGYLTNSSRELPMAHLRPLEHPHLRRRAERPVHRARPGGTGPSSRTARRCPRPSPGTPGGSTRSGGRGDGASRPRRSPTSRCTPGSASSARPSWAGRTRRPPARRPTAGAGRGARPPRPRRRRRTLQPPVPVDQRPVDQLEPGGLPLRHPVELEPVSGRFEGADRHVHADDLLELLVLEQFPEQLALAAAEVEHPPGTAGPDRRHDRPEPLLVEAQRPLQGSSASSAGRSRPLRLRAAAPRRPGGRGPDGRGSAGTSGSGGRSPPSRGAGRASPRPCPAASPSRRRRRSSASGCRRPARGRRGGSGVPRASWSCAMVTEKYGPSPHSGKRSSSG